MREKISALRLSSIKSTISILYFLSIFAIASYPSNSWETFFFGVCVASVGSILSLVMLSTISKTPDSVPLIPKESVEEDNPFQTQEGFEELESALHDSQVRQKALIEEMNLKNEQLHKLEKEAEQFTQKQQDAEEEFTLYKTETEEELRRKTVLLAEYQETINQQREVIKAKGETIEELEGKVKDLSYEVKTLLQLAEVAADEEPAKEETVINETASTYQVAGPQASVSQKEVALSQKDASAHLRRCIDMAQTITGANHFGRSNSRFKEVSVDHYALNQRRLFDRLQSESGASLMVYSQKEGKLLFANRCTSNLLGWDGEEMVKQFSHIIGEDGEVWKNGVAQLSTAAESRIRLAMKTKGGETVPLYCHLGAIPRGAFRNHIVCVLYPASLK